MTWTGYDWLSRGLLLFGMWFIASGTAGLLVPEQTAIAGNSTTMATGIAAVTVCIGVGTVLAGFVVFTRHVEEGANLALSADEVAAKWTQ